MISLPTPMQPQTSQSLTPEKREGLIDLLVERYLDGMSVRDLALFFTDVQTEWLQGYSDGELLDALEDMMDEEEFQEAITSEA